LKQTSKAIARRQHIPDYTRRFFVGEGLDIGGGPDPLGLYQEFFCRIVSVRTWDIADGDAQTMPGIPDDAFDFSNIFGSRSGDWSDGWRSCAPAGT
jgi:hypothetical protein